MNWNQIEQKWGEMTRRVQPPARIPARLAGQRPDETEVSLTHRPSDAEAVDGTVALTTKPYK